MIVRRKKSVVIIAVIIAIVIITNFCSKGKEPEAKNNLALSKGGVAVLAYHYFNDRNRIEQGVRAIGTVLLNLPLLTVKDAWTIRSDNFEKHLRYLDKNGYRTITMNELKLFMLGEIKINGKCVAITFDDGDRSVYKYAYPLLKKYKMNGTLFLITSKVGQNWDNLNMSSREELCEMNESGVINIESHTHDMHFKLQEGDTPHPLFDISSEKMDDKEKKRIFNDLRRSRLALNLYLGTEARFLAWPYGSGTELSDSLAVAAGFEGILTLRRGRNHTGDSLFKIKRFSITSRTSFAKFKSIVGDSYE
ncbi:polysaccharide deacetylase family protein [bacterium]|nr:polysaccharide deacetylase family protein [bacterium]